MNLGPTRVWLRRVSRGIPFLAWTGVSMLFDLQMNGLIKISWNTVDAYLSELVCKNTTELESGSDISCRALNATPHVAWRNGTLDLSYRGNRGLHKLKCILKFLTSFYSRFRMSRLDTRYRMERLYS